MKLTQHDISTPLWQKLEAHYAPILVTKRALAENPELAEAERIKLLWQIKFIKEFLEMAEPSKK